MTKEEYISLFQNNNPTLTEDALLNFPSVKDEAWKHTHLTKLLQHSFVKPDYSKPIKNVDELLNHSFLKSSIKILFHNGRLVNDDSFETVKGLRVFSGKECNEILATLQQESVPVELNSIFSQVNDAFVEDLVVLKIENGKIIEEPIEIIQLIESEIENVATLQKLVILAGENSQCKIVESFVCGSEHHTIVFQNIETRIVLNQSANVEYNRLQNTCQQAHSYNRLLVSQFRDSIFHLNQFSFNGGLLRNEIIVNLNQDNCETILNGLYLPSGENHTDNYLYISHNKPNCKSKQLFKGIVNDKASSVFLGRVYVAKDAQKTDAYQSNKNILLTADAKAYSKPQLEIYADDVKCSHGSSTGQLDKDQLFYMQARGISKSTAKILLLQAYAGDLVNQLTIESFKEKISSLTEQTIR